MTVDLSFPRGSLFPEGRVVTTIEYDNDQGQSLRARVAAGMFGGIASNGVNFDVQTLYRSENDVLAYCIDIVQNLLRDTNTYHVRDIAQNQVFEEEGAPRRDFGRMLRFLGATNAVVAERAGAARVSEFSWLEPTRPWMSGAIQVGIWESLYEDPEEDLNIDNGWFEASSLGDKGNSFLDDIFEIMEDDFAPAALNAGNVKWMENARGQDLLVDPVDVPVPASFLLLVSGLGLMRLRSGLLCHAAE